MDSNTNSAGEGFRWLLKRESLQELVFLRRLCVWGFDQLDPAGISPVMERVLQMLFHVRRSLFNNSSLR